VVALALHEVHSAEVNLTEHDERQRASSVSLSTERYPIVEIRVRGSSILVQAVPL